MIHEVHSLRMLCGEIVAVQAFASNAGARLRRSEDTVAINLRFAGGALGTFMLSDTAASARNWEHTSRENADLSVLRRGRLLCARRHQRQSRHPDHAAQDLRARRRSVMVEAVRDADPATANALIRSSGRWSTSAPSIRGAAAPLVSARDGLQNLRVTEAIVAAARSRRVVEVPIA